MKRTAVLDDPARWTAGIQHRCSQAHCPDPAVARHVDRRWSGRRYTRYWCERHLAGIGRFVRSGRVFMRVEPDDWLTDLSHPWPPYPQ